MASTKINRIELEKKFAGELRKKQKEHQRELKTLLGNPPSLRNVPAKFWKQVEQEIKDEITRNLIAIWLMSANDHLDGLDASDAPTPGATEAADWASSHSEEVSDRYITNARERLKSTFDGGTTEQSELSVATFRDDSIEAIAVTETTAAISAGGEAAMQSRGRIRDEDTWYTVNDNKVCPVCEPLHRTRRPEWSLLFPKGPPAHPRCRCHLAYAT